MAIKSPEALLQEVIALNVKQIEISQKMTSLYSGADQQIKSLSDKLEGQMNIIKNNIDNILELIKVIEDGIGKLDEDTVKGHVDMISSKLQVLKDGPVSDPTALKTIKDSADRIEEAETLEKELTTVNNSLKKLIAK